MFSDPVQVIADARVNARNFHDPTNSLAVRNYADSNELLQLFIVSEQRSSGIALKRNHAYVFLKVNQYLVS